MKPILSNDFRALWSRYRDEILAAVERVGTSGRWVLGPEVADFESALAARWGLAACVGCASGLDALEIGLRCAGLAPGERVLTTPLSAFATSLAVVRAGGVPVFADVDETGLLDLDRCERVLENEAGIRFLLPVHLFGHAIDLERLHALRERFSLRIVEDCAQSIGARSGGRAVGTVGDFAATSFYPTKNLGCMGDGGALLTSDGEEAAHARALRDYGQREKYDHVFPGLNSRLDEVQAAVLHRALLPDLASHTRRRREIAAQYREGIVNPALSTPPAPSGSESVWHLYPVLVPDGRDAFRAHLGRAGVQTGLHYPFLIPDQSALADEAGARALTSLSWARRFSEEEVSLPIHPFLSDEDVERVVVACNTWPGSCSRS